MDAVLGRFAGIVRGFDSKMWSQVLTATGIAYFILILLAAAGGLGGALLAVLLALFLTVALYLASQEREATLPSHPQMGKAFATTLAKAASQRDSLSNYLKALQYVVANDWAVDQLGEATLVDVTVVEGSAEVIIVEPMHLALPVDGHTVSLSSSRTGLFRQQDQAFWDDVWMQWRPHIQRTLARQTGGNAD